MLFDGITLNEGSHILNASIESGASFPLVPNVGELFYKTSVGLHVFDGSTWNLVNTSDTTSFILKSGGTMTGYLVLNDDPTTNLQAATKHYVDNSVASYAPLTGTGTSGTWGISITGNAATVTTNANLTGVVTSVGNATSIGAGAISNTMLANSAVANLSGTNTGDQTISISGDVTASGSTGVLTATVTKINGTDLSGLTTGLLKNTTGTGVPSIAVAGTDYLLPTGSAASLTNFPTLNQNTTGNAATASAVPFSGITSKPTTLSGYGITDGQPLDGDLTSIAGLAGTSGLLKKTAANTWALDTNTYLTSSTGVTSVAGTAGNITASASTGAVTLNLATITDSGLGSFKKINTDGFGRVTGTTTVTSSDITTTLGYTPANKVGDSITGNFVFDGVHTVTGLPSPTGGTDAANKNYVDAATNGLTWKSAVRVASTTNINLTTGGLIAVDGVTTVAGDRVLVKDQTLPKENGIYIAGTGAWTRASDMNLASEFDGSAVFVKEGTLYQSSGWTETATVVTVGTDTVTFSEFTGGALYTWGVGLANTGNTVNIQLGAGIAELPTDEVGIDVYSGGGLMLTVDGTTSSTSTAAQVSLTKVGTSGTYTSVSTDSYGRVTSGSNPATVNSFNTRTGSVTLTSGDVTSALGSTTANYFLATPNGSTGTPSLRAIVAADIPTLNQNTTGNAGTATILQTGRTIALSGAATGTATSFDGSANITIPVTSLNAANLSGTIPSAVLGASTTYVGTTAVALNRASAALALTGITGVSSTGALTLSSTTTNAVTLDSGTTGAVNIGNNANAKTITVGNVTGATGVVVNSGTAGVLFNQVPTGTFAITATAAPTTDMTQVTAAGVVTAGVNALSVTYSGGAAAVEASAARLNLTPGTTSGGTWSAMRVTPSSAAAAAGVTMNGVKFDSVTAGAGTDNMIYAGTGWDNIISYNGTSVVNGSGQLNAAQLTGTVPSATISGAYSGITTLGISGQLTSTLATGTAPFAVSSTTPVDNLSIGGNAATASTANALNTGNNYQMNSLGVGTAGSGTAGEIRATNNVTAYYSSDSRLKENIKPIENALAKVKLINGVTYDWTEDFIESHGGEDGYFIRKHDVGVIAQEVEAVMPEIVVDRDDGYKAVKYERMVALLIEAVKELSAEIEVLKAKVN
jgi:hypothetical protein